MVTAAMRRHSRARGRTSMQRILRLLVVAAWSRPVSAATGSAARPRRRPRRDRASRGRRRGRRQDGIERPLGVHVRARRHDLVPGARHRRGPHPGPRTGRRPPPLHDLRSRRRAASAAPWGSRCIRTGRRQPFVYVYVDADGGGHPAEPARAVHRASGGPGRRPACAPVGAARARPVPQRRPDPVRPRRQAVRGGRRRRTTASTRRTARATSAARSCGSTRTGRSAAATRIGQRICVLRASATPSGSRSIPRPTACGRPRTAPRATTRST